MINELSSDEELTERINHCTEEDLENLQEILNEPHPKHSPNHYKSYESKEYMIHNFLRMCGSFEIRPSGKHARGGNGHPAYEEIINHLSEAFGAKNKHGTLLDRERKLAITFFEGVSINFSESNISAAQKKYLKFKPDLLAHMFCDEMRKQKNLTGLLLLAVGAGGGMLAETFQKFSFEEVTALAFIAKLHFIMIRRTAP